MGKLSYTVSLNRCESQKAKGYLCEFEHPTHPASHPVKTLAMASVSLQWQFHRNSSGKRLDTISCPKGHVTHTFLACDLSSDCWLEPSGGHSARDGVKCSAPLRPLPPSFDCRERGQRVAYSLVCDHRPDCFDGSDEHFCVFGGGDGERGGFLCSGNLSSQCGRTHEVSVFFFFFFFFFLSFSSPSSSFSSSFSPPPPSSSSRPPPPPFSSSSSSSSSSSPLLRSSSSSSSSSLSSSPSFLPLSFPPSPPPPPHFVFFLFYNDNNNYYYYHYCCYYHHHLHYYCCCCYYCYWWW